MRFRILKNSKRSRARLGILETPHGTIETPALVPVATQAVVKTLTSEQAAAVKCQVLIGNTFHLHLKPGEQAVKKSGGLHRFMHWPMPLMTDSGGFQVFSLGFGRDFGLGKMAPWHARPRVGLGSQPQHLAITDRGVRFRSPLDGQALFIGPQESMKIQEALGADIILAFDECPPPTATKDYVRQSLGRTHAWAEVCLREHRTKQSLLGIVQGGRYQDLRRGSAEFMAGRPFAGFGIGGEFGTNKSIMAKMVGAVNDLLPPEKPRHLLGIGHPEDIRHIIAAGVDTFDCIVPTHYARHGTAFTSRGRLDLTKPAWLNERKPLDLQCGCDVCHHYTRAYIAHLVRAKEITGLVLLTMHNLWYFNTLVEHYRTLIKQGKV
ncbi:MAG: tRNA guanosine(34) transglycosylase Tgt [Candidatus Kerfeldbacteria bacterium]|nr:tRNA guanosine(34) transglycosylase Tgt [Candidatus Kerfeldbacteria bacterium]